MRHVVQFSGGKDSTALLLLALERMDERPRFQFLCSFADTGHEHPVTLEHVERMSELSVSMGGPPIRTVRADFSAEFPRRREAIRKKWPGKGYGQEVIDAALEVLTPTGNPFLDLCLLNQRFPTHFARFCTRRLKIEPCEREVYQPLWQDGHHVLAWTGVRREESRVRAELKHFGRLEGGGPLRTWRPLLDWTLRDVWRMHERHGVQPNELYRHGLSRVGCFPCIFARKGEVRILAERFPEAIDRLDKWERLLARAHPKAEPTWFPAKLHEPGIATAQVTRERHGIREVVRWSRTTRGGKQFDMMPIDDIRAEFGTSCDEWGTCE